MTTWSTLSLVIAGLDPAIHRSSEEGVRKTMDARVELAHDAENVFQRTRME